jgi:hypothetical protein
MFSSFAPWGLGDFAVRAPSAVEEWFGGREEKTA